MNLEELKYQVQCVFNKPDLSKIENEDNYILWLIAKYGCYGFNFDKSIKIAKAHAKAMEIVYTCGHNIDDYSLFKAISGNLLIKPSPNIEEIGESLNKALKSL